MLIGLTGGICSGKSTVADFFANLNTPVIKADPIVHDLLQPHTLTYQKIVAHLGQDILNSSAAIERAKLRQIIFTDQATRIWLENLLHPYVYQNMLLQIKQLSYHYCIVELPLLIEKPPPFTIDRILVIDCSIEQQIARVTKRDNISIVEARKIISVQIDKQTRLTKGHDTIVNESSLENLKEEVIRLHNQYIQFDNN